MSKKILFPTKTCKKGSDLAKEIEAGGFACAGPYPNITGMKLQYWGVDAKCVRVGSFVYKVDDANYSRVHR